MRSPSEYLDQIKNLDVEGFEMQLSSLTDARDALKICRAYQKELREIKKCANQDIRTIRAEYKDKIANAGSTTSFVFSLFKQTSLGGMMRTEAKSNMRAERDKAIAPYNLIKDATDELIHSLDDTKEQINSYITQYKKLQEENKDKTKVKSCPICGAKIAKSYKYCAQCGFKI